MGWRRDDQSLIRRMDKKCFGQGISLSLDCWIDNNVIGKSFKVESLEELGRYCMFCSGEHTEAPKELITRQYQDEWNCFI